MLTPLLVAAISLLPVDETGLEELLARHRGQVVVLNFWATWCGPCRDEFPGLVALYQANRNRGLQLLTVSMDEPEDRVAAERFLEEQGAPSPAYIRDFQDFEKFVNVVDPEWVGVLPATFVFDRTGRLRFRHYGEVTREELEREVAELF
ncbi:MAG: TlpA disulfide reductase family protein [Acidobacteriota bacterium]